MDNLGTYYLQLASKVEGSLLRLSLYLVGSDTISKADSVRIKLTVEHPADIMVYYLMWGWGGSHTSGVRNIECGSSMRNARGAPF